MTDVQVELARRRVEARSSRIDDRAPARATSPASVRDPLDGRIGVGSVIIPANNEEAVLARTLRPLAPWAANGSLEVIVSCNGCTDGTAALARQFAGVRVLESSARSKVAALNEADAVARLWPRLYLDADIELSWDAIQLLFAALLAPDAPPAARLEFRYDYSEASWLVRSYYRARSRNRATAQSLWGAGSYALSAEGRARFDAFPAITADDAFVDSLFFPDEKRIVPGAPVIVRTPRTLTDLLAVLQRNYRGAAELAAQPAGRALQRDQVGTLSGLVESTKQLNEVPDTLVYVALAVWGRWRAHRAAGTGWERDESSRHPDMDQPTIGDRTRVRPPVSEATPHKSAESDVRSANDAAAAAGCDHILLTRFNLPSQGLESLIRAKDGWLRERVTLFERYCVPSVQGQQEQDFHWIVYFDPESPDWLRKKIEPYQAAGVFTAIFRAVVGREEVVADIRKTLGDRLRAELLTTNLDNDDALSVDFTARARRTGPEKRQSALYLANGLIVADRAVFLRHDVRNAFCSVREPWDDPLTCWVDWHNRLTEHMPALVVEGPPAWLQVIHGSNVSNRVRGRRLSPLQYTSLFPGLIDDAVVPSTRDLARERLLLRPRRYAKEAARAAVKQSILRTLGPGRLDRVKVLWVSIQDRVAHE